MFDDEEPRTPRSVRPYRPGEIPGQREWAEQAISEMGPTYRPRASTMTQHPTRRTAYADTCEDTELAPSLRRRSTQAGLPAVRRERPVHETHEDGIRTHSYDSDRPRQRKRGKHPLFWVSYGLLAVASMWWLSTTGASAWVTHISDPSTYGPLHGTITTAVIGGGDNAEQPSTFVGMNDEGQVLIMVMLGNDPAKSRIILGPNLVAANFPDPAHAEVEVQSMEHDGHTALLVTVWSSEFDRPLHRYSQTYWLLSDGKGNLTVEQ